MQKRPTIDDIVSVNPEVMSGMPVFRGTRVPIDTLFLNLRDGMTVEEILEDFPTLDRDDVMALLEITSEALVQTKAA
jgi:uncharacterized protein (DUF433 family)